MAQRLSPRALAFVRHYVANGGNGTRAAVAAGYSVAGAAQQASALLKRVDVQAELALVRAQVDPRRQLVIHDGQVLPPLGGGGRQTTTPVERLTRAWIVETLLRQVDVCMGDMPGVVTARDGTEMFVRRRDAPSANRAIELLDKQLDKLAGLPSDLTEDGLKLSDFVIEHHDKIANMRERLKTATRSREQREREPVEAAGPPSPHPNSGA